MSLAGCPFGRFSLSKQYSSVSSSGPDTTSYPIETNKSSTSSITLFNGCSLPLFTLVAGRVTSIFSFSSLSCKSLFLNSDSLSSIICSISSLILFTRFPTTGLSSAAMSFIPLKISVSSPFFPKTLTLKSFKAWLSLISAIFSFDILLIASSFSFIKITILSFILTSVKKNKMQIFLMPFFNW